MHGRGTARGHRAGHSYSGSIGQKAQLTTAYQELAKELSSTQIKTVGNYTLGRVIGEGSFGKVRLAVHKLTSQRCAIKQIPRSVAPPLLTREIHHHRRLHHPNVLQLYEVIATESNIWLITELCAGGELFDYLVEKGRLGEHEVRRMFGQLCLGVGYIHGQGVVHRDLKLENVLLDERCNVKIADFGFGREFEQRRLMETFCGTTGYAAPEMLAGKKYTGEEVDVWSLGVILYALLTGSLPFDDDDEEIMKQKILVGEYDLPTWLSQDSRDLIEGILQLEPRARFGIKQILAHDWFVKPSFASPQGMDYFQYADFVPEVIPEEGSTPPPDAPVQEPLVSTSQPAHISSASHQVEPSSASSQASTSSWHSAATSNESDVGLGIRGSRPTTPITSDESEEGRELTTGLSLVAKPIVPSVQLDSLPLHKPGRIPRNASQTTITRSDSRRSMTGMQRYSPLPPNESPVSSYRFPPPSPAMLDGLPHGSPALPIPAHSRTPSRTKRRSIGSTLSERALPQAELPALPDYLAMLSLASLPAFSTALEKQLLESIALLGLDSGQMVHSVRADACDAAGAVWWMLKSKAEQKEAENAETSSIGPATSNSVGSLQQYHARHEDRAADSGDESRKQSLESMRGELSRTPLALTIPVPVLPAPTIEVPASPKQPAVRAVEHVEYGGPAHTPSPRKARAATTTSTRMASMSAPILSPASKPKAVPESAPTPEASPLLGDAVPTGPKSPSKSIEERSPFGPRQAPTKPVTKPRSASVSTVSMLQRATSALGVAVGKKDKVEEQEPAGLFEGRSTPSLLTGGLFGRKSSTSTPTTDKPPFLQERKSSDRLAASSLGNSQASVDGEQTATDPHHTASERKEPVPLGKTPSTPAASPKASPLLGDVQSLPQRNSPAASSSLRASVISNNSTAESSRGSRTSKNLFSSLKFWLNDEKRKKRNRQSAGHLSASMPVRSSSFSSAHHSSSIRQTHPHIHAPSPLQRPPIARMPSNTPSSAAVSRRNSSTSARRIQVAEQSSPLLGHGRRRSDASRRSFGSMHGARTPVEDRDSHRPSSAHGPAVASADVYNAARKRHGRAGSSSSAGSRHSTMISGSPIATYRRTPAVTQVRRVTTPKNRISHHSRNASNPSSVHTSSSRRSSMSGIEAGPTIIEEEENMEDSVVELERDRALRKLSGTPDDVESAAAAIVVATSAETIVTPLTEEAVAAVEQDRPTLEDARRPSSEVSHRRSRQAGASSSSQGRGHARSSSGASSHLFAAHKVVNPFGTPNGSHFVSHSQRSAKEGSSAAARPKLRDIFAKKAEGEDGWVDDDEDAYTGGFGQGSSRTASSLGLPSQDGRSGSYSSTMSVQPKTPDSPVPNQGGPVFGEGRYAGMSSMPRGESVPSSGSGGRRPAQTGKGPSFKRSATVVEEEEEEEE